MNRLRDVFEPLLAHVADIQRELTCDLPIGVLGKADGTRPCQSFDADGNVDTITVNIALVDEDVTYIDANAKFYAVPFRNAHIALSHGPLDFHGATDCVHRARKLDESTVARRFYDAATIFC